MIKGGENMTISNEKKCCCCGGGNEFAQLDEILAKYQGVKGALIPVLQEAQNAYGYLSKEVIEHISGKLDIPVSQIYGVVTFYSQFHLNPRGRNIIRVCQGTACHVRGAKAILKALEDNLKIPAGGTTSDLKFTLETVACIGACGLAPVMMVNDDTHGRLTPEIVPEILAKYA
jgi:NADH-quinone oxidoreductase E subunit